MTNRDGLTIFFSRLSAEASLKFKLAWLTFLWLCIPMAVFVSFGLPQQFALPLVLVLAIPAQYVVFRVLEKQESVSEGLVILLGESAAFASILVVVAYIWRLWSIP